MTDSLYKSQAARLADYLSRVHGVKLKHAAMLEAVAQLHGQADWNTLLAAGPSVAPAPAPTRAVRTRAVHSLSSAAPKNTSFDGILQRLVSRPGSTGLHLSHSAAGYQLFVRCDGVRESWVAGSDAECLAFVEELKRRGGLTGTGVNDVSHGGFTWLHGGAEWALRVYLMDASGSPHVYVRWTNYGRPVLTLENLGLTRLAEWRRGITQAQGLCLVVGPTESGCTTTLESSAHELASMGRSVLDYATLRDTHAKGGVLSSRYPMDGVDVIVFGEIRDRASAQAAVEAAGRGHLVLASMHASSLSGAFSRLADLDVSMETAQSVVRSVLAQKLIRRVCRTCAGQGCDACHRGYIGRTMVSECVTATRDYTVGQLLGPLREAPTMLEDGVALCHAGVTDTRELVRLFGIETEAPLA